MRDHLCLGILVGLVLEQVVAATGTVQRSDAVEHQPFAAGGDHAGEFGIEFGLLPIGMDTLALGDEVKIELDLEFIEPKDETVS